MLPRDKMSDEYDLVETLLDDGFAGTWAELGAAADVLPITAYKLTDSYVARHPETDVLERVHNS
jgi:hypothetical protein